MFFSSLTQRKDITLNFFFQEIFREMLIKNKKENNLVCRREINILSHLPLLLIKNKWLSASEDNNILPDVLDKKQRITIINLIKYLALEILNFVISSISYN